MRRGACAGTLIAALAFGAVGCGGGGENDKVKSTVKNFFVALADRDGAKACALLSKALVQSAQVGGGDCAKSVKAVAAQAVPDNKRSEARNIGVSNIKIRGNAATASAKGTKGQRAVTLVKEGGKWKLATL
jgi:hypothetical protein